MLNTFSDTWSPRTAWDLTQIRAGALVTTDPADSQASADAEAAVKYWSRSVAFIMEVLGRRFPDALAGLREALLEARELRLGPYSPEAYAPSPAVP